MWQKFEGFIQSLFGDSEIQQCGFYLFKRLIDSGGIRVVLWSLYQDFETAAAQARHTDNHEHPRIVCGPRPSIVSKMTGGWEFPDELVMSNSGLTVVCPVWRQRSGNDVSPNMVVKLAGFTMNEWVLQKTGPERCFASRLNASCGKSGKGCVDD